MGIDWNSGFSWDHGGSGGSGGTVGSTSGVQIIGQSTIPTVNKATAVGVYVSHATIEVPVADAVNRWITIKGLWLYQSASYSTMRVQLEGGGGATAGLSTVWSLWGAAGTSSGASMASEFLLRPDGVVISNYGLGSGYGSVASAALERSVVLAGASTFKIHLQSFMAVGGSAATEITLHGYTATMARMVS